MTENEARQLLAFFFVDFVQNDLEVFWLNRNSESSHVPQIWQFSLNKKGYLNKLAACILNISQYQSIQYLFGIVWGSHVSQIITASSDKSVMISQVTELRLSRILNQNLSQKQWVPAVLGSSKNTDSNCLKFHPYSSVVPKLASPLPLGCKSWRHTAIRPYEMPVVDTSYVKASNPTFLGAGF